MSFELLKVACAIAPDVALVVRLNVFEPLVIVIVGAVVDVGAPAKVPVAFAAVALVVRTNPFDPLGSDEFVIVTAPVLGEALNVPVTVPFVPLFVSVNVFDPLVIPTDVVDNGEFAKVPVAFEPAPLLVRVMVLEAL